MSDTLLSVKDLKTYFYTENGIARAVDGVSFDLNEGKSISLVGESGCGKSITALSIMRLVHSQNSFFAGGSIHFQGRDILRLNEQEIHKIRGNKIAMIFQEPAKSLNPVLTIGYQLVEPLKRHQNLSNEESYKKAMEMLDLVKIPDKKNRFHDYPYQLSGGMKQRIMIAMAIACEPLLLIADEPTTALDVKTETGILNLIQEIKREKKMSMILITHDMLIASNHSDQTAVMYAGKIMETAASKRLLEHPSHPYTYKLLRSMPAKTDKKYYLESIQGRVPSADQMPLSGCRFAGRCHVKQDECERTEPILTRVEEDHMVACILYSSQNLKSKKITIQGDDLIPKDITNKHSGIYLSVEDLQVFFPIRRGILKRTVGYVKAIDGVDLKIPHGNSLALVGESGCGKTTLGRALLRLIEPSRGDIFYLGENIKNFTETDLKEFHQRNQIVFQDPFSSLNPKMIVGDIISEGLLGYRSFSKKELDEHIDYYLDLVGLDPKIKNRYPHEFSGGQRQRIGIARSIILEPDFIICDEVTSALDVSVQAQILNLLTELQAKLALTYLFITHDPDIVKYFANHIAIMQKGKIMDVQSQSP